MQHCFSDMRARNVLPDSDGRALADPTAPPELANCERMPLRTEMAGIFTMQWRARSQMLRLVALTSLFVDHLAHPARAVHD